MTVLPGVNWEAEARAWIRDHERLVAEGTRRRAAAGVIESAHARLGPSSAHRWLRCPASVQASEGITEERTSEFAAEGTVAHHVREMCLAFGFEPYDFLGEEISADGFTFTVEDEMVEALTPGIEWVRERPGLLVNEYRVRFDRWLPEQFGTQDVGLIAPDLITINDLKYGVGVAVSPERNEQLMIYALGFWENIGQYVTKATDFLLVIDQPRIIGSGGGEWHVTLEELLEFGERLKAGYAEVHSEDPAFNPGEKQCRWCAVKETCPARAQFVLSQMDVLLDDLDADGMTLADADRFTPARRAVVAENAKFIKDWADDVRARVLSDAIEGNPTPGVKAVPGKRGNKAWIDEAVAYAWLAEKRPNLDLFGEPKLITPSKAGEKIPKGLREEFDDLWMQPDGKPVLVRLDDDRPAVAKTADMLDDLD